SVHGVGEREQRVTDRQNNQPNQDQQHIQKARNCSGHERPKAGQALLAHIGTYGIQPILYDVSNTVGVVDEVRYVVEHAVHGPKRLLVVDEDQTEHEIFDPRYSERSHIAAVAVSFVDCVQETENEDHARELQHWSSHILVDAIQRCLEHLLEVETWHKLSPILLSCAAASSSIACAGWPYSLLPSLCPRLNWPGLWPAGASNRTSQPAYRHWREPATRPPALR